jgi:hypothetical protein
LRTPRKFQTNTNDQTSKYETGSKFMDDILRDRIVLVIGISYLGIISYLGFEI